MDGIPAIACGRLVDASLHVNTIVDIKEQLGWRVIYKGLVMRRIAVVLIFFSLLARAQTTFDLSADFSLHDNPNKVWQYGYSETNSLAPDQFRFDKQTEESGPIGFWHPDTNKGP
jgi:hypothetical protein